MNQNEVTDKAVELLGAASGRVYRYMDDDCSKAAGGRSMMVGDISDID